MDLVGEQPAGARKRRPRRFLDARARRIEEPNERLAVTHRQLADARGLELLPDRSHRARHHGEVVCDDPHLPAIDVAVAGDHAVGRCRVGAVSVLGEKAKLHERAWVE